MEHGTERVLCIIRRFGRVSYSRWSGFHPERALPEERRFELLDGTEKKTGELRFLAFNAGKESLVEAPWGQTRIYPKHRLKGIQSIEVQGRPIADVSFRPLKNDLIFTFANGAAMKFDARIVRSDLDYVGDMGTVKVREEKGRLEPGQSASLRLGKDELKSLNKAERPKSYEIGSYIQLRVLCSGILPVDERDLKVALAVYICDLLLVGEELTQSSYA